MKRASPRRPGRARRMRPPKMKSRALPRAKVPRAAQRGGQGNEKADADASPHAGLHAALPRPACAGVRGGAAQRAVHPAGAGVHRPRGRLRAGPRAGKFRRCGLLAGPAGGQHAGRGRGAVGAGRVHTQGVGPGGQRNAPCGLPQPQQAASFLH